MTLAKSYEPYGTVLTSTGTASSIFAYAGEQIDTTGLIYLRARYMNPRLGMFLARDPWSGDQMRPGSMNGFNYVEGNPINAVDPTGREQWWRASSPYERIVEWEYERIDPYNIHLEYRLPTPLGGFERPDIIRSDTGDVYEIEPLIIGGLLATAEATYYVQELNTTPKANLQGVMPYLGVPYNWTQVLWHLGDPARFPGISVRGGGPVNSTRGFPFDFPVYIPPGLIFRSESDGPGAILWWFELDPTDPILVTLSAAELARRFGSRSRYIKRLVPQPVYAPDTLKELICEIAGSDLAEIQMLLNLRNTWWDVYQRKLHEPTAIKLKDFKAVAH